METAKSTKITIEAIINVGIENVWEHWTNPKHIIHWNFASDDWHSPRAENDLRKGGRFSWRMEAKEGTMGFDFTGKYDKVETNKIIKYTLDDNRFISIEHQAIIHDGKKISSGPEADLWSGSFENYIFTSDNGKTKLTIEMKIPRKLKEEYKSYFLDTWPKALNKLKAICEA